VFTDADNDQILDSGEGIEEMHVVANSLAGDYTTAGVTTNGILTLEILCPPGKPPLDDLEISVPYLGQTQLLTNLTTAEGTTVVQFALPAPLLPIALP
ncbi:MAG: hypothetical protein KDE51_02655, partial [Anaerolineales bacterium]|nr:hypothetical protein [Anaerolineales bacterium]